MSGLLSRCPPLRAQAHTVRKPGCLRACCVRCPACPRWSFALRSCRSPLQVRGFPRSHLVCPHVLVWARSLCSLGGVLAEACCGRVCSRVAGVGCLRYCPCSLVVFACFGVCARLGVVGHDCPAAPAPLAWLVLTLWCGLEKRVREPVSVWGGNGAGQSCPAPCAAGWCCRRCVRVEERRLRVGVPGRSGERNPTSSLVLAYMETGSHPVGAKQRGGATGRAWWPGWGWGAFLVRAP